MNRNKFLEANAIFVEAAKWLLFFISPLPRARFFSSVRPIVSLRVHAPIWKGGEELFTDFPGRSVSKTILTSDDSCKESGRIVSSLFKKILSQTNYIKSIKQHYDDHGLS
jgi:hypothetical protein